MAEKPPIKEPVLEGPEAHARYKHPILTDAQVDAAKAKALKTAQVARVKAAMEDIEKQEAQRLLEEEGMSAGGVLDEMVSITLDLSPDMPWLRINGISYENRKTYTVRRARANDLMFMQMRGWMNETARKGDDRFSYYQQARAPLIKQIGGKVVTLSGQGVKLSELG